jgi:hypothetical protein
MTKIEIPLDIPNVEIENIEINKEGGYYYHGEEYSKGHTLP